MWGSAPESGDFSGRYKLRWNKDALYLLAEIQDDHLSDTYANPLERYWDDDCLEISLMLMPLVAITLITTMRLPIT